MKWSDGLLEVRLGQITLITDKVPYEKYEQLKKFRYSNRFVNKLVRSITWGDNKKKRKSARKRSKRREREKRKRGIFDW